MSIIAASGHPDWKRVKLPAGRTKKACLHIYNSLKKQAENVALGDVGTSAVAKPRKKAATNGGPVKRKRGKGVDSVEAVEEADDEEGEGMEVKKPKTDVKGGVKEEVDDEDVDAEQANGDDEEA